MRYLSVVLWLVAGLLGAVQLGCGHDPLGRQPVSGVVTLNGVPLTKGTVNFHPVQDAATSSGGPIEQGQFALDREQGLAAGQYRVTINAPKPGTGQEAQENTLPGDPLPVPEELIPEDWNVNSNHTIEVTVSGPNKFSFEVKSKGT